MNVGRIGAVQGNDDTSINPESMFFRGGRCWNLTLKMEFSNVVEKESRLDFGPETSRLDAAFKALSTLSLRATLGTPVLLTLDNMLFGGVICEIYSGKVETFGYFYAVNCKVRKEDESGKFHH